MSMTSERAARAVRPRLHRSPALSAPPAAPGQPSPADLLILAAIANGRTYEQISKKWGISRTGIGMRIRRICDGEPHRPTRRQAPIQVIAIAVRDRWIVWSGGAWVPGPGPDRPQRWTTQPPQRPE